MIGGGGGGGEGLGTPGGGGVGGGGVGGGGVGGGGWVAAAWGMEAGMEAALAGPEWRRRRWRWRKGLAAMAAAGWVAGSEAAAERA